jgi:hypothetical protein
MNASYNKLTRKEQLRLNSLRNDMDSYKKHLDFDIMYKPDEKQYELVRDRSYKPDEKISDKKLSKDAKKELDELKNVNPGPRNLTINDPFANSIPGAKGGKRRSKKRSRKSKRISKKQSKKRSRNSRRKRRQRR